jgi:DNA-binding NarL/FixJ family response regulator
MPITLVLADDHPVVLAGLEQLLAVEGGFAVLARCSDGAAAVAAVHAHRPDLVVLDLKMPTMDGLAALRALRDAALPTRPVILTASLGDRDVLEAVRLGARGVVLKEMAPSLLVECLRTVHAGGRWLEEGTVADALGRLRAREAAGREAARRLTPRELEVVQLVAAGRRNKEIARELAITEGTVKIHLSRVYEKLGVDNRVALTRWAQAHGLV